LIDSNNAPVKRHNFLLPDGDYGISSGAPTAATVATGARWQPNRWGGSSYNVGVFSDPTLKLSIGNAFTGRISAPTRWQINVTTTGGAGYYTLNVCEVAKACIQCAQQKFLNRGGTYRSRGF
jgi:hypothetical protein